MLVHICCSVDSHFFLSKLKKLYPNEKLIGFFYDPNIHPLSEYELRFLDVKRSCNKLNIKLFKGDYDYELWLDAVKNFENEPEKGLRCEICFDKRIHKTIEFALKIGEKKITTTLLASPKKDLNQLQKSLQKECDKYNIEFLTPDFRKNGGTQRQFQLAKQEKLYHQNYCGCIFALIKQKQKNIFIDELMSPITKQILPASINDKILLYKNINILEKKAIKFDIKREKFLNYRLLYCLIKFDKIPIKAHILFYSHFKHNHINFTITQNNHNGILESFKDELIFWDFEYFNKLCKNKFKNFIHFLNNPLSIKNEIKLRYKLLGNYNLNPIIICEKLPNKKVEISVKSEIYFDIREKIVLL